MASVVPLWGSQNGTFPTGRHSIQIRHRPVRVLPISGVLGLCGVRARAECFGDIGLTKLRPALSKVLGVATGRLGDRMVSSALGLGKSGISRRTSTGGANKAGATWLGRRREPGITGSSWLKRKCAGASRSLRACFIPCLPYQSYIRSAWFTRNVCFTSSSILSSSAKLVSWQQQDQESSKPTHCYECCHDHSILSGFLFLATVACSRLVPTESPAEVASLGGPSLVARQVAHPPRAHQAIPYSWQEADGCPGSWSRFRIRRRMKMRKNGRLSAENDHAMRLGQMVWMVSKDAPNCQIDFYSSISIIQ